MSDLIPPGQPPPEPAPPVTADPLIGRTLADFVVRERLGEGGFGAVYRAEQVLLNREAVIKVLHVRHRGEEAATQRFLREAHLASRLDHPYAAHIYAFGVERDGLMWIAMELVRGTPLDQLLEARGPLPLSRLVPLVDQIAEVVHTAHEQGIIHRDLKPANIMVLSRAGRLLPKLLDFGIAKVRGETGEPGTPFAIASLLESEEADPASGTLSAMLRSSASVNLTQRGLLVGSPHFMAPEQWIDAAQVDARADIYALGVIAYKALTQKFPFDGKTPRAIARAHAAGHIPSVGTGFPEGLDRVFAKALARRQEERYGSAVEFASDLRAASGITSDAIQLPQIEEDLRSSFIADAPLPIADALTALEAARNAREAVEACHRLVRTTLRYLGLLALVARVRIGPGGEADAPEVLRLLRKLRGTRLEEAEWVQLLRELLGPFALKREVHPIPELISLCFEAESPTVSAKLEPLAELVTALGTSAIDQSGEELARQRLPLLIAALNRWLRNLSFLREYPLVVRRGGVVELWMGARRAAHPVAQVGDPIKDDEPAIVNGDGGVVLALLPLAQALVPTPGAPPELFMLDGDGRHGARLIALPSGFERHDADLWAWFGENFGEVTVAATAETESGATPYRGLAAFTAEDASHFFGREKEAEAFANRLRVNWLLAVVGPSGSGKSSFVQAGVLPSLPTSWKAIVVRPGPTPLQTLTAKLATEDAPAEGLRAELEKSPAALGRILAPAQGTDGVTVLVVDQFEELLTLCSSAEERNLYAEALVLAAGPRVRVVLTLRDDFLIRAQQLPALRERLAQGLQLLGTPALEDLRRILLEPARRAGYGFEDAELADKMVASVREQAGALALLSFTASKLWELRDRRLKLLTTRAYHALGGVGGALGHHAESVMAQLKPEDQMLVRQAFRHLVTADGTRAVLSRTEMMELLGSSPAAEGVLERLIQARLLVASEGAGEPDRIEVIHEALLGSWPRLVRWQREDAESARLRDQLRAAARQWEDKKRPKGVLWRSEALMEYRVWRTRYQGALTQLEEAFAAASLREEARGRKWRRSALATAFVTLTLGSAALFQAQRTAKANEREALHRIAELHQEQGREAFLAGDPLRGLAYLSKAYEEGLGGAGVNYIVSRVAAELESQVAMMNGHGKTVMQVEISPDGTRVLSASLDGSARIWDLKTGRQLLLLQLKGPGSEAHFSPDNRRILTTDFAGTGQIWDATTGLLLGELTGHRDAIRAASFSPDGKLVVTASADRTARIWDTKSFSCLAVLTGHTDWLSTVAFSPDGTLIATGSSVQHVGQDDTVRLWNARTGAQVWVLPAPGGANWVTFSPDGQRIASGDRDGTARVWSVATGRRLALLQGHMGPVYEVAFSPDGSRLVTGSADGTARIWDSEGRGIATLVGHKGFVRYARFFPDGRRVVTGSDDDSARIWDSASGQPLWQFVGHTGGIASLWLSKEGDRLVTGGEEGSVRVWDTNKSFILTSLPTGPADYAVATHDGTRIISSNRTPIVRIWDRKSGQSAGEIHTALTTTRMLAISPDDSELLAFDDASPGGEIMEFPSGKGVAHLRKGADAFWGGAFSPDGKSVATANGFALGASVWDSRTGALRRTFGESVTSGVGFGPVGQVLATGDIGGVVRLWDLSTGTMLRELKAHTTPVRSLTFSGDGRLLLSTSDDSVAKVWQTADGSNVSSLVGHRSTIYDGDLSPNGELAATASADGTFKIWESRSGRELETIFLGRPVFASTILSEGGVLLSVSASDPSGVQLWTLGATSFSQSIPQFVHCRVPYVLVGDLITLAADNKCAN